MLPLQFKIAGVLLAAAVFFGGAARGQNLDQIGVTLLRRMTTNLDGSGIRVAQPEGSYDLGTNWEVNPGAVGWSPGFLTFFSANGATTNYPNDLSSESSHADEVAAHFYGLTGYGVATNIAHVDSFDADYFINTYVYSNLVILGDEVVNQSFTFGALSAADQQTVDSAYDDYAETNGTIFVSAADNISNDARVRAPGTAYNCISVGAYANGTYYNSHGPTIDNGRCKPDLTAPNVWTSFSTPQVAGAVALLMQAARRGDGGDTNAAGDPRTVKALLLNGAVKPADWTNANAAPLDARYGAGVVNIFNAYEQLAGGRQIPGATNLPALGAAPGPVVVTSTIPVLSGWDLGSLTSGATHDAANHYYFNVPNGLCTATLVWSRHLGQTNINDLDLYLFNAATSNLVACSTSRVDNVEHIYAPRLAAGRYELQVLKNGGTTAVSDTETYALAWAIVAPTLNLARSSAGASLTWPVYPAGFRLEATTNLVSSAWSANNLPAATLTNGQNFLAAQITNAQQFFRLRQPDF